MGRLADSYIEPSLNNNNNNTQDDIYSAVYSIYGASRMREFTLVHLDESQSVIARWLLTRRPGCLSRGSTCFVSSQTEQIPRDCYRQRYIFTYYNNRTRLTRIVTIKNYTKNNKHKNNKSTIKPQKGINYEKRNNRRALLVVIIS